MTEAKVRRVLNVERVLSWAVEELAKRAPSALALQALQANAGVPAGYFQGRTSPMGYPSASPGFGGVGGGAISARAPVGLPHPDAKRVEAAIARLAGWSPGFSIHGLDDGMRGAGLDCVGAMRKALTAARALILHHATLGTRPKYKPERFAVQAVTGPNGKPVVVRKEHGAEIASPPERAGRYTPGTYCKIVILPPAEAVLRERADYAAWRLALDHLSETLQLETIVVTPSLAARRPWLGERDQDPRVLDGGAAPLHLLPRPKVYPTARPRRPTYPVRHIKPPSGAA
jgi:hypothetical protein